jgi:hypothetical protein
VSRRRSGPCERDGGSGRRRRWPATWA